MSDSSLASSLLIAMPQLEDPNFKRCVVLLLHHDANGAFGLVLSRSAGVSAIELCDSLEVMWEGDPTAEVGTGGPVQPNTGWVLFGDGAPADIPESTRVTTGLHFAGSIETLREIAAAPPGRVRLFLGYSGWGPSQIEQELAQGAWLLAPATPELVFDVPQEDIWNRVLSDLGVDPATLIPTPGIH